MKTFVRILIAALAWNATISHAQVYNILHNFPSKSRDGFYPQAGLLLSGETLYGTTVSGGTNGNGTIFKINTDGTGYSVLQSPTNSNPDAAMVLIDDTLYGTASSGGAAQNGSIFKINTNGGALIELYTFSPTAPSVFGTNSDGNRPRGGLVTDGTTLYGTAQYGGTNGNGTVFKINTDGSDFTVIKTFPATFLGTNNVSGNLIVTSGTNLDGAQPAGGLVLDGNTLYGTTFHGGVSNGVVFSVKTDGNNFTVLKYFSPINGVGGLRTNSDGAGPIAGLIMSGDALYGVAVGGGAAGVGNIFKLNTNGTGFTNLHDFVVTDGGFPRIPLLLDGATLYGTTATGGTSNQGTIFMVLTNGVNFTVLKSFDNVSGSQCDSKFVVSSNMLFGTGADGGSNNLGVIFSLAVLPRIISDTSFGIQSEAFGFDYTGISNQLVVIDSCTNLSQPIWLPLQTNHLIGSPQYFADPAFNQKPNAFYRIRSP